eukprot:403339239
MNNLIQSFKIQLNSSTVADTNLDGPFAFQVPKLSNPKFQHRIIDDWEEFDSHKFLNVNIMQEYLTNRIHLPLPPDDLNPKMQEAFITLNLLRDDPEYIIQNMLIPLKGRYIDDPIKPPYLAKNNAKYKLFTYSYGTIKMKNGPEVVDELIRDIRREGKIHRPLVWSNILAECAQIRLHPLSKKLLNKNDIDQEIKRKPLHGIIESLEVVQNWENLMENCFTKSKIGFEFILMLLIDDQNDDRRNRKALLDRNQRLVGLCQMPHTQFDYINSIITCSNLQALFEQEGPEGGKNMMDMTTMINDQNDQAINLNLNNNYPNEQYQYGNKDLDLDTKLYYDENTIKQSSYKFQNNNHNPIQQSLPDINYKNQIQSQIHDSPSKYQLDSVIMPVNLSNFDDLNTKDVNLASTQKLQFTTLNNKSNTNGANALNNKTTTKPVIWTKKNGIFDLGVKKSLEFEKMKNDNSLTNINQQQFQEQSRFKGNDNNGNYDDYDLDEDINDRQ